MALIFWDARDALPRLLTFLILTGGSQTKLSFATHLHLGTHHRLFQHTPGAPPRQSPTLSIKKLPLWPFDKGLGVCTKGVLKQPLLG